MASSDGSSSSSQIQVVQPQNQLVTIKLNESNYLVWKHQILTAIKGYGLEAFITGSTAPPSRLIPGDSTDQLKVNPEFVVWQRQDQLLASWILSSLSDSLLVIMVGLESSREMWEALELNFASHSKARLMQYKLQLQTLKKGSMPMREYLNKNKACCDTLAAAGQKISEEDQVLHILSGLGSEYDAVMVTMTSRIESCTVRDVSALLLSMRADLNLPQIKGLLMLMVQFPQQMF